MVMTWLMLIATAWLAGQPAAQPPASSSSLDFMFFKDRVQPILTTARKGNARCIACHSRGGGNSYLEGLPPGSTATPTSRRAATSSAWLGLWFPVNRSRVHCS